MTEEAEAAIKQLISSTNTSSDSHDAMRYSQAATNVANAYATFVHAKNASK